MVSLLKKKDKKIKSISEGEIMKESKVKQTADAIRAQLLQKEVKADSRAPSVRWIADRYAVSSDTAHKALRLLEEHDFLYSRSNRGMFVKHDPQRKPKIGLAAVLPVPGEDRSVGMYFDAISKIFADAGCEMKILPWHEFKNPEKLGPFLANLDGLLISVGFIEPDTLPLLLQFHGKIVVFRNEFITDILPCSQVIPDFSSAFNSLAVRCDFSSYEKIILVSGGFPNSNAREESLRHVLERSGVSKSTISTVCLSVTNNFAELAAYQYFKRNPVPKENILICSLSPYYCRGILEIFNENKIEFDLIAMCDEEVSIEMICPEKLVRVDSHAVRVATTGAELLVQLVKEKDDRDYIVKVPALFIDGNTIKHGRKRK